MRGVLGTEQNCIQEKLLNVFVECSIKTEKVKLHCQYFMNFEREASDEVVRLFVSGYLKEIKIKHYMSNFFNFLNLVTTFYKYNKHN